MPQNKLTCYRLSAAFIEKAHDVGISYVWPGIKPVQKATCLDLNLLYSAASQPYQEVFGCELYPTLAAKSAYLFYHLATGHVFSNGNKRTAALCLDQFILANGSYLTLSNDEIHDLAQQVASSGERKVKFSDELPRITTLIEENLLPLAGFRLVNPTMYRRLHQTKRLIRTIPLNQEDHPLAQRQ